MIEAKRSLRKKMIAWRSSLTAGEVLKKSEQIAAAVKTVPEYIDAKTILFYVSAKPNEADTHSLIREALSGNIRVLVPSTDFDRNELIMSEIKDMKELEPARYGLLEPRHDSLVPTDPGEADVIIVPGVAFDRHCRRIGFGGGYYDRLLADSKATTIALSYEGQMVERVPVDENDIPVDLIVTESAIYRAGDRDS
jgi:5-formyltetrahydrofolate cyclo-ligase